MMTGLLGNTLEGFVLIDLLQRQAAADCKRLGLRLVALILVEIEMGVWGHYGIESRIGSSDSALGTAP